MDLFIQQPHRSISALDHLDKASGLVVFMIPRSPVRDGTE